jgi:hypothetical protein
MQTGLHPSEIHRLVTELDWGKMLRGEPEYSDLSYQRKQDLRAFQKYLAFGMRQRLGASS